FRLLATARATLGFEAEMRNQVLARQLQTKPLRVPVLGLRNECDGSCGIEQDDIASSVIYDSVVLNDCRSACKLNHGVIVLHVITPNVQFRPLKAGNVAGKIHCSESEDAPRAHLADENVGFASGSKPSPIVAHCSSATVIVQFLTAEKIIVWVQHPTPRDNNFADLIVWFVVAGAEATSAVDQPSVAPRLAALNSASRQVTPARLCRRRCEAGGAR